MNKTFINKFTKHLVLASKKLENQKAGKLDSSFEKIIPSPLELVIDLGKLNKLVLDSNVKIIECPGAGKEIKIKHLGKIIRTGLKLKSSEIRSIIENFSKFSGTPLNPLFKAKVKNISLTASISSESGTKFIIVKEK